MKYIGVLMLSLMSLPVMASKSSDAVLMHCYTAHETQVEVAACLDNHWQMAESKLIAKEKALTEHFAKLDAVSSMKNAVMSAKATQESFNEWRDKQCKMVEASFASGSGSGLGYLSCKIELTNEQIDRINHLMGGKDNEK
ncbi:lysozyme inhibitor LprI family protein [Enterovibrio norvegicus]|uniref:lysozyme inhibitor LprI family protein n=1 Tax=Enterovibrio norvegicus TaxID=188144 RepID=UPI0010BED0C4|nr:lysozyme inhibitor LprI family protein [Enterovibrio norvegicus]TKF26124.1 DUF1311 domain-containing protein [Enterovibrio norvegicus]